VFAVLNRLKNSILMLSEVQARARLVDGLMDAEAAVLSMNT
jgi:hypothetical protein